MSSDIAFLAVVFMAGFGLHQLALAFSVAHHALAADSPGLWSGLFLSLGLCLVAASSFAVATIIAINAVTN